MDGLALWCRLNPDRMDQSYIVAHAFSHEVSLAKLQPAMTELLYCQMNSLTHSLIDTYNCSYRCFFLLFLRQGHTFRFAKKILRPEQIKYLFLKMSLTYNKRGNQSLLCLCDLFMVLLSLLQSFRIGLIGTDNHGHQFQRFHSKQIVPVHIKLKLLPINGTVAERNHELFSTTANRIIVAC